MHKQLQESAGIGVHVEMLMESVSTSILKLLGARAQLVIIRSMCTQAHTKEDVRAVHPAMYPVARPREWHTGIASMAQ